MRSLVPTAVALSLACVTAPAIAATGITGTMSNFDVFNDSPSTSYEGAELELEGLHSTDVTETYTWTHFPSPTVTEYTNGSTFGVRIRYSSYSATTGSFSYSVAPFGGAPASTGGHFCVQIQGCEHFGFSVTKQPTATRYFWLDHPAGGAPGSLVRGAELPMAIPTPVWNYVAPAGGGGGGVARLEAEIRLPEPVEVPVRKPDSIWVKVFKTEVEHGVRLEDLISGNALVPQDAIEIETEWKMLENGKPLKVSADLGENAKAVIRRYELFKYSGAVDEENQPLCLDGNCDAPNMDPLLGPVELGAFIGAQMAAANLAPVPEPQTYAMMVAGLCTLGVLARRRRQARPGVRP